MLWKRIERPGLLIAGPLRIDRAEHRAWLGGGAIELSPLLLRLVGHLAERPGRVVTRAELKRALWPYAERIDTERRLNTAIRALRAALGDDADSARLIETVRSHGYRWIGCEPRRRPNLGIVAAIAMALGFGLAPSPATQAPDLAAALKAQRAMEDWRRAPGPAAAARASALLADASSGRAETPSLLVMRAELALGARWDWPAAERDYRRALSVDPSNADARLGLAWLRVNQGRNAESLTLVSDLVGAGVASGDRRASLGWLLIRAGRPDLAADTCGAEPSASLNDLACSHEALAARGRFGEAKLVALRLMERASANARIVAQVNREPPRLAYRTFLDWRAEHFLPADASWFQKAQVLADAGRTDGARHALEQSVAAREPLAVKIASTPAFAPLRRDPRFARLVRQVGA